jgi:hypothetical protein
MYEYEATNLQITQGWISMNGVHPFYQCQVVLGNDNVRIASENSQK